MEEERKQVLFKIILIFIMIILIFMYIVNLISGGSIEAADFIMFFIILIIFVIRKPIESTKQRKISYKEEDIEHVLNNIKKKTICNIEKNKDLKELFDLEFITFVKETFIKLQNSLNFKNINVIRPFVTKEIFNIYDLKIKLLKSKYQSNILKDLNIISVKIVDYKFKGLNETVYIEIHCDMKDYIIDDLTKKVVVGNQNEKIHRRYLLTFSRNKGLKNRDNISGNIIKCINCSAPIDYSNHGQCEYCGSVIKTGINEWVITSIEIV